jgi:hypothetical protein
MLAQQNKQEVSFAKQPGMQLSTGCCLWDAKPCFHIPDMEYQQPEWHQTIRQELQFSEYVQLLILNAQVYDTGKKNCSKSAKIDVNLMDLAFKEIETDEMICEINKHDINPSYGQLEVNVNDTKCSSAKSSTTTKTGLRKVFVDHDTWRSLSQANQTTWDKLTDGAKTKIVGYKIKKGKQLATESQSTEKHSINFHDVEFDDDITNSDKEPAALKVGTHEVQSEIVHMHKARRRHPPQVEDSPLPVINPPMTCFPL